MSVKQQTIEMATIEDETTAAHAVVVQDRRIRVSEIFLEFLLDAAVVASLAIYCLK